MKHSFLILLSVFLVACGGGGGGGGGGSSLGGSSNPGDPGSPLDTPPLSSSCSAELESPATGVSVTLENLGRGCDYRVSRSVSFRNAEVVIEAGTTFQLEEAGSLTFNNATVSMIGSSSAPIVFQSASEATNWTRLTLSDSTADLQFVLISGGGRDASQSTRTVAASMVVNDSAVSMANVSVLDSATAGLSFVGNRSSITRFENNVFAGNATYGISVDDAALVGSFGVGNNFSPADNMNGIPVIFLSSSNTLNRSQVVLADYGVPYLTAGGSLSGRVLILEGVEIWVEPGGVLELTGSVNVFGTSARPVIFRGRPDVEGTWGGLLVSDRTDLVMRHFVVDGGGSGPDSEGGSISLDPDRFSNTTVTLSNGSIENSTGWALFCEARFNNEDNFNTSNVTFDNSLAGDVHPSCDIVDVVVANPDQLDVSSQGTIDECAEVLISVDDDTPRILANSDASCDYYLVGGNRLGSTVLIEPGTRVLFAEQASLTVTGTLTARGTSEEPIVLDGEVPVEGYWDGLVVGFAEGSEMTHVQIENGGREDTSGLQIAGGDIALDNVSVMGAQGDGLTIENGVTLNAFTANTLVGNGGAGLVLPGSLIGAIDTDSLYDSDMAPNGIRAIVVQRTSTGSTNEVLFRSPESNVLRDVGVPWLFPTLRFQADVDDPAFVIEAGTRIMIRENSRISVRANLTVMGTEDNPVQISGYLDAPALWGGISVGRGVTQFDHASIQGGGLAEGSGFGGTDRLGIGGALQAEGNGTELTVRNTVIRDSQAWGFNCINTRPENLFLENVSFENNELGDINPECGR